MEKIENQIKEVYTTETAIKPYIEFLKKCLISDRSIDLKAFIAYFHMDPKLFSHEEEKIPLNFFYNVQFSEKPGIFPENPQKSSEISYKGLIFLPRKGLYEGEIKEQIPHGTGTFTVKTVAYEGKFEKGRLEGYGRYRSNEWEMMYDGKFSENIARHGVIHLNPLNKTKENPFENHSYTEFEKEYYLPNYETLNKMIEGFDENSDFLEYSHQNPAIAINPIKLMEKIKEYKQFFDGFLKEKEKFLKIIDVFGDILYYKDEGLKEFIVRKFEMIKNFIIIYNENISKNELFYFDQISFGLFSLEKLLKNPNKFSAFLFEAPLSGSLISYFGKKISGSFLDFKPLYGYKFNNFLNYSSFNNLKLIYQGTLKLLKEYKRDYHGSFINEKANGYGEEIFNENYIYKGFYKDNEPFGKGVLQEKTGKALIKGFFKKGLPLWGTYHKDKDVKYKGNFSFNQEITLFSFKSIKELIDSMIIKGFVVVSRKSNIKMGRFLKEIWKNPLEKAKERLQ